MNISKKLCAYGLSAFLLLSLASCNGYDTNGYGSTINTNKGSADGGKSDTTYRSNTQNNNGGMFDNGGMTGSQSQNGGLTDNFSMGTPTVGSGNPNYFA